MVVVMIQHFWDNMKCKYSAYFSIHLSLLYAKMFSVEEKMYNLFIDN